MAIADRVTAAEIGRVYAEAVRDEPAAWRLRVSSHRDYYELWLVTEPIEPDVQRRLYTAELVLYDRFPGVYLRLHILNPMYFDGSNPAAMIPLDAEEILLRPA